MAPKGGRSGTDVLHNEDLSFDLQRLFDHYNMDHIPRDQRLNGFKHRDLPHVKHYKAAVNIFGGPLSRKRTIIAPPMETPMKHRLGLYMNRPEYPTAPVLNNQPQVITPPPKPATEEELEEKAQTEKEASYKKWFAERQALRSNLNGMGLNEDFLRRKTDKTELETRVQRQLKEKRTWKPPPPPEPVPPPEEKAPPVVPSLNAPVPIGMQILDRFLAEKKLRLIDLFTNADRNKDWRLTKEELHKAVNKYKIPLSTSDIEDMMVMLDQDFDEHLDYGEVSRGLKALRVERRISRKESGERGSHITEPSPLHMLTKISPFSRDLNHNNNNCTGTVSPDRNRVGEGEVDFVTAEDIGEVEVQPRADSAGESVSLSHSGSGAQGSRSGSAVRSRVGSAASRTRSSSSTPNSLEPPPPDLREERRLAASDEEMLELRKHDKTVLERAKANKWPSKDRKGTRDETPGVICIGHKAVDNHCRESTLEGETGALMDSFRRNALKEYFQVVRICRQNGVILTPELLDRVLLYPPDLPHSELLKKRLRIPGGPLSGLNEDFAKPPRKPKTPPEIRHKDRMKRTKSGALLIDSRHMYPSLSKVQPQASKENLSTGRALVARKTQCWMSFEEYEKYTRHLPIRYIQLNSPPNKGEMADMSKFWPGYMLDKLALCMPMEPHETSAWDSRGTKTIFQPTRQQRHAYPAKYCGKGPVISDHGCLLLDHNLNYK